MPAENTIFVVDDDPAVRKSMTSLLKRMGLPSKTYASAEDFQSDNVASGPGCLLLDVRMAGKSGTELHEELVRAGSVLPVIIVTGHAEVSMAVRAIQRGAVDFLEKPYRAQALQDAILRGLDIGAERRRVKAEREHAAACLARLTARERQVVDLAVCGLTNKEIAGRLGVSPQAIDARRTRAMRKLELETLPDLVRLLHQRATVE